LFHLTYTLRRVCVFCGSSVGAHPDYWAAAEELGTLVAKQGIGLVYGGGRNGLMGVLADAALAAKGEVIGVIPRHLEAREVAHRGLSSLRVVDTMHARKALMADLSDAFIALPGGLGTMEEFLEVATWTQLGIHQKPLGLLNVQGYYDLLDQFLGRAVQDGFVRPEHRALISISDAPARLVASLGAFSPDQVTEKWLDPEER
jgi:uncharacterized protein (TIGR00730 family)